MPFEELNQMDKETFQKYKHESGNWLHNSRRDLMFKLLKNIFGKQNNLSILEIGAGVGQYTVFLQKLGKVDVVEINEIGIEALRSIPGIRRIFTQPIPFVLDESYDLIVIMDVLEHIQDDKAALQWIADKLRSKGILFLTVPAYQWLFSEHDMALQHFRRYVISDLKKIFPYDLKVIRSGYFNTSLFPIVASFRCWKKILSKGKMKKSDFKARVESSMLPKPIDKLFRFILKMEINFIVKGLNPPFGLSAFCIAERSIT
jgi:SAM-dependent methyltransferase